MDFLFRRTLCVALRQTQVSAEDYGYWFVRLAPSNSGYTISDTARKHPTDNLHSFEAPEIVSLADV